MLIVDDDFNSIWCCSPMIPPFFGVHQHLRIYIQFKYCIIFWTNFCVDLFACDVRKLSLDQLITFRIKKPFRDNVITKLHNWFSWESELLTKCNFAMQNVHNFYRNLTSNSLSQQPQLQNKSHVVTRKVAIIILCIWIRIFFELKIHSVILCIYLLLMRINA